MWYQITGQLTPGQIADNQNVGLFPNEFDVAIRSSREHWDVRNGDYRDGSSPKYWRYKYPKDNNNRHISVVGALKAKDEKSYQDAMWALFGPFASQAANTYREFASLVDSLGGIPQLREMSISDKEADRLNVAPGPVPGVAAAGAVPYPLGMHGEDGAPTMPGYMLVFAGSNVMAMRYQEFPAWARAQQAAAPATPVATPTAPSPAAPSGGGSAATPGMMVLPPVPTQGVTVLSVGTGRVGKRVIDWDRGGLLLGYDGETENEINTGFTYFSRSGGFGQGGLMQDFVPTAVTVAKICAMMEPFVTKRGGRIVGVGQQAPDAGVSGDPTIVIEVAGQRREIPVSPLADKIAAGMYWGPLSTGAVPKWHAEMNETLDTVWNSLT